jgi:hypothetical protein
MHINMVRGNFLFCDWKENGWNDFRKKEYEIRRQGYRKVEHEYDSLNQYVTYKRKKKRVVLTMLLS